jgi:hypothetical protein
LAPLRHFRNRQDVFGGLKVGRPAKGPRLYKRPPRRPGDSARWVILDQWPDGRRRETATGAGDGERETAEKAFLQYLEQRTQSPKRNHRPRSKSYIYVVGAADNSGTAVKIGVSTHPEKRLHAFQNAHHVKLKILAKFPGTRKDEIALHQRFATRRIKGEWFQRCPALDEFINSFPDGVAMKAHRPHHRLRAASGQKETRRTAKRVGLPKRVLHEQAPACHGRGPPSTT